MIKLDIGPSALIIINNLICYNIIYELIMN